MRRRLALIAASALALSLAACGSPEDKASEPQPAAATEAGAAPEMPADAPPQEEAPGVTPAAGPADASGDPGSCSAEIGRAAADRLVERCVAVSPATRPPCNVQNSCAMIRDEIERGCGFFDEDEKPAECAA